MGLISFSVSYWAPINVIKENYAKYFTLKLRKWCFKGNLLAEKSLETRYTISSEYL